MQRPSKLENRDYTVVLEIAQRGLTEGNKKGALFL